MAEVTPAIELIEADIPRTRASSRSASLRDVTWRVGNAEFWAVGAAPGQGKTDLLCTAAALQRPLKGSHLIFGKDTRQMDEAELVTSHRQVAMIFDTGRLFPNLTVAENLALPLAYHLGGHRKEVRDRVEQVLQATGLLALRNRRPNEITRNWHQRVGLARALALDPHVLLVDSPLLGIDPRQGRWWLEFLCDLNRGNELTGKRGLTIAVATDDLRPWLEVATQFAVVSERTMRLIGGPSELRATREAAVQELLTRTFDG